MRRQALGAATLILLVSLMAEAPATAQTTSTRTSSYAPGHVALFVDGVNAGFVQAVRGGTIIADAIVEATPPGGFPKKRPSPARFDPLQWQTTTALSKPFFQWLSGAVDGKPPAKTGMLVSYDALLQEQERRTFANLRVVEVGFPILDAASKSVATLTVVAQADSAVVAPGSGQPAGKIATPKPPLASSFRLILDNLDTTRVSSISPITVKLAPRGDISNFSVTIGTASTASWRKWHEAFVVKGQGTDANEKSGMIELFAADMKSLVLRVRLEGVGILRLEPATSEGGAEAIPRMKAELYAESIRLELP